MRINTLALSLVGLLAGPAAFAHGTPPAPKHGGTVAEGSGEHWVEMNLSGDKLSAWVSEEDGKAVPAAKLAGKATVLVNGKAQSIALHPQDDGLAGTLATSASGRTTAVLSLTAAGEPVQVRFVFPAK